MTQPVISVKDAAGATQVRNCINPNGQAAMADSQPVTLASDQSTLPVSAASLPLPTGAATALAQTSAQTTLSSLDSKAPALVSGRVPVDGSGVTQPVSVAGTVGVNANGSTVAISGTVAVDGSGVTQPVSLSALPLPNGAATSAKQPGIGTAGTASADVLTVQGKSGMVALQVDGSGYTSPVSVAALPLPSGAATVAKQPALGTAGTPSADVLTVQGAASMRALLTDGSATTQPVSVAGTLDVQGSLTNNNAPPSTHLVPTLSAIANVAPPSWTEGYQVLLSVDLTGAMRIAASALPLPSGASTAAKQPALGTAGTPSADVLTVQGAVSMRPVDNRLVGSASSAAAGISAGVTGYGILRTSPESITLFTDPFDGAVIDVTNRWANAGTAASQTSGLLSIAPGTVGSAFGALTSLPTFQPPGLTFLGFGCALQLEATIQTNTHRFWGLGTANLNTTAAPLTDAIGFELGTDGVLYGVVYANTVRTAVALTVPVDGAFHKYVVVYRADTIIFYRDSTDLPVGSLAYTLPNVQSLPVRLHCINGATPPGSAPTFKITSVGLNDTGRNAAGISDGTYAWRKATVSAAGALSVTDSHLPAALGGQAASASLPVTLSTENMQDVFITGQGSQSASGNNILLAVAGTTGVDTLGTAALLPMRSFTCQIVGSSGIASGQVIFEQSNDNVNWGVLAVQNAEATGALVGAAFSVAASTSVNYSGKLKSRYVRCRISTVFAGGTIQAFTRFSACDYSSLIAANNLANVNGITINTGIGAASTGTQRVAVSTDSALNVAQFNGTAAITASPQGATNKAIAALVPGSVNNTDYSAQAWAAASGNGATIAPADGTGAACAFDVSVTAFTAGSSTGLDIYLQESPDNGTTWYDIWQCVAFTGTGHDRIPAIPVGGRRRMRWVNRGGAATTATVTVVAMSSSIPWAKQVQWYDRTAGVGSGTAVTSTNTAAFDISGCKAISVVLNGGAATVAGTFKAQMSMDGVNWYDASTATTAVASTLTPIVLTAGVYGRFIRVQCVTGGTADTMNYIGIYGTN